MKEELKSKSDVAAKHYACNIKKILNIDIV